MEYLAQSNTRITGPYASEMHSI